MRPASKIFSALAACGVLVALTANVFSAPRRDIRSAESTDRLTYAFVFGHRDTCRVIRRTGLPPANPNGRLRRYPDNWNGATGEKVLGEFSFGRTGRPLHVALANDGKWVIAFANRASPLSPEQDAVWSVTGKSSKRVEYEGLPGFPEPTWPTIERELADAKPIPPDSTSMTYAFVVREIASGRMLVARQSEGDNKEISELSCFALEFETAIAKRPAPAELKQLLRDKEPIFRAAAARQIGLVGERSSMGALKSVLQSANSPTERATIAAALVRCGNSGSRKTLRGSLMDAPRTASYELATLPPDSRDVATLLEVVTRIGGRPGLYLQIAIARLGSKAVSPLRSFARSSKPEVRVLAASLYGRIDAPKAEVALLKLVGDPNESVRKAAARAMTNPPRRPFPSSYEAFAKALLDASRTETKSAAHRLATLAMHAELNDERILVALVELTKFHKQAIRALQKLTGLKLITSDDWQRWLAERR